jgi:hypothetical protein
MRAWKRKRSEEDGHPGADLLLERRHLLGVLKESYERCVYIVLHGVAGLGT